MTTEINFKTDLVKADSKAKCPPKSKKPVQKGYGHLAGHGVAPLQSTGSLSSKSVLNITQAYVLVFKIVKANSRRQLSFY